jgi:glycosyltransferase involved in cell wall biosynthesis
MRITFVTFGQGTSGGDRDTLRYAELFRRQMNEVTVIALDKSFRNPMRILGSLRKIPTSDALVSIYSLTTPVTWIAERMGKGKAFYFVWHFEPILFYRSVDFWKKMISTISYRLFPCNRIIANSNFVAQMLSKIGKKNIKVVNPGIDHSIFYPRCKNEKPRLKRILTMARTEKWKGFDDFIVAAKELQKSMPVEVILVSKQREIANYASDVGMKFVFGPSDEELALLYSTCDVYVHSSWYEGFGLPPVEAMACGVPVVTTDSLGVRDYAVNEINCLLVPPRNPVKLLKAIKRCLTDDELVQSISKNGLATAAKFDIEKAAAAHLKILEGVINITPRRKK